MANKRGFTLIELMVVVAIIAFLGILSMPTIRSMNATNARAQTLNTINAALMSARSYAIMNGVTTAARFQPNGKIFLVYHPKTTLNVTDWNGISQTIECYLPVINQEPLQIPSGYAVADGRQQNKRRPFCEPFYIAYNLDGTFNNNVEIITALAFPQNANPTLPVNPSFPRSPQHTWQNWMTKPSQYSPSNSLNFKAWVDYAEDPDNMQDPDDRALARFYNVARSDQELDVIINNNRDGEDPDYGPDHFGGFQTTNYQPPGYNYTYPELNLKYTPTNQLAIFKTPDNWDKRPLFDPDVNNKNTKQRYVDDSTDGVLAQNGGVQTKEDEFSRIFINSYTGRVIRPLE